VLHWQPESSLLLFAEAASRCSGGNRKSFFLHQKNALLLQKEAGT